MNKENRDAVSPIDYNWLYKNNVSDIVKVGLLLDRGLKQRDKIVESGVTWCDQTKNGVGWQPCARIPELFFKSLSQLYLILFGHNIYIYTIYNAMLKGDQKKT